MAVSLLDPTSQAQSQAKFTYAVPSPPVLDATGGGNFTIQANTPRWIGRREAIQRASSGPSACPEYSSR